MSRFSYRVKLQDIYTNEKQTITVISKEPVLSSYAMQQIVNGLEELDTENPYVEDYRLEV